MTIIDKYNNINIYYFKSAYRVRANVSLRRQNVKKDRYNNQIRLARRCGGAADSAAVADARQGEGARTDRLFRRRGQQPYLFDRERRCARGLHRQRLGGIRPRQRLGDELREFQSRPHIERRLCRGTAGVFGVLRLRPLARRKRGLRHARDHDPLLQRGQLDVVHLPGDHADHHVRRALHHLPSERGRQQAGDEFRQDQGESEHERARPFQRRRGRGRGKGRAQRDRRLPQKPSKIQRGRRAYPQGRAPCRSSRYR